MANSYLIWRSFYRYDYYRSFIDKYLDFVANTASPRRTKRKSPGKNEPSLYDDFPEMSSDIYAYIFSICEVTHPFNVEFEMI